MSASTRKAVNNGSDLPTNFFDLYDSEATQRAARTQMHNYRQKLKGQGKRGGPNQNTKETMYAIFNSVCQTMNRIRVTQPALYQQCIEENKFFCFTTIPSLQTIINKGKEFDDGRAPHKDTIRNQIDLLVEIGVLAYKKNYRVTEDRRADPLPEDCLTCGRKSGRGKIGIGINENVFKTFISEYIAYAAPSDSVNSAQSSNSTITTESFRQLPLSNKEPKEEILDTSEGSEEQKALANAKTILSNISGKVRASKHPQGRKTNIWPENLAGSPPNKKDIVKNSHEILSIAAQKAAVHPEKAHAFALWQLLRGQLYAGDTFNEEIRTTCMEMLHQFLFRAQTEVRNYRKELIKSFKNSPIYLERAPKKRPKLLKWFQSKLPHVQRSALEIVSGAIETQKKHCDKNNYQVWRPVSYLASFSAQKAFGYSLDCWLKLKKGFFNKNLSTLECFQQRQFVEETYSNVVATLRKNGAKRAHLLARDKFLKWLPELHSNTLLSDRNKSELEQSFVNKFKALFNHG